MTTESVKQDSNILSFLKLAEWLVMLVWMFVAAAGVAISMSSGRWDSLPNWLIAWAATRWMFEKSSERLTNPPEAR